MPDFSLCSNLECALRDNCKRAIVYNDNKPNQTYTRFEPTDECIDYFNNEFAPFCEFQKPIK